MMISGLANLTLLDFPGKTACTVFTGGCNLRCPFCHNAPLVTEDFAALEIGEEKVFDLLKKRKGILDGVCITGGEPLLQKDIADFISRIKDMGFAVKLDTNGTFPQRLEELIGKGLLDYVAMDIKNSREFYAVTVGIENFDTSGVEKSVSLLLENRVPYEFRTTVINEFHSDRQMKDIAQWIEGAERYYIQCFKDSGNLIGDGMNPVSKPDTERFLGIVKPFVKNAEIRGM